MCCSLDEEKIFERILADNWEAKDRSIVCMHMHMNHHVETCAESCLHWIRLEKAAAKLPKKDLAAVKKRFTWLEVTLLPGRHAACPLLHDKRSQDKDAHKPMHACDTGFKDLQA